jgi:hypothetical protein
LDPVEEITPREHDLIVRRSVLELQLVDRERPALKRNEASREFDLGRRLAGTHVAEYENSN